MSKKLLNYLLIFLSISLVLQVFFVKPEVPEVDENNPIIFETRKESYPTGKVVDLKITNNTADILVFEASCPKQPFNVLYTSNEPDIYKTHESEINCEESTDLSAKDLTIRPGKTSTLRYTYWSSSLFNETGRYKIMAKLKLNDQSVIVESNEFEIRDRGFLGKIWISGFYQPIYNFLIFLIDVIPGHHLGLAIILLTLILRLLLFAPSHKALRSQKKMAEIQPQLNEIKKKYKDNQQLMAAKTMEVWKEHGVSPASSCLPLLIQFPILIALFYVIQDGLNPDKTYLLYKSLADFNINTIQTMFLGLDLKTRSLYILPIIVGGLQYLQLSLAQTKKDNKASKDGVIDIEPEGKKDKPEKSEAEAVQNMMKYFMPAMIAVFTASMPSGVGLYWGTSTLFSIVQQLFINTDKPSKKKKPKKVNEKNLTKIKI